MRKRVRLAMQKRSFKKEQSLKKIVNEYMHVTSHHSNSLPYGISLKKLPYPKKKIQDSIERLYSVYVAKYKHKKDKKTKKYLEVLKTQYAALGSFLPGREIEFKAPLVNPTYAQLESFLLYVQNIADRQRRYALRLQTKKSA